MSRRDESSFEQGFGMTCGCIAAFAVVFCLVPVGFLVVGNLARDVGRPDEAPPTKRTEPARSGEPAPKDGKRKP